MIFSCSKAITSAAAWLLLEEGKLGLGERVADVLPEFATNGKDAVTVEQLFTHTAGFPQRALGPQGLGLPRGAARALRALAPQLGAGLALRVPPELAACG